MDSVGLDVSPPIYRYGRNFLGALIPLGNGKTDPVSTTRRNSNVLQ
jgi:hypothetical protein